jgi:hypothetical protein
VFAVVEDQLKTPVGGQRRKPLGGGQVGGVVAVEDLFEVAVGADDPVGLAAGERHVGAVFGFVHVADRVAAIIEAHIQQPAEYPGGVGGVGDAAGRGLAIQTGDVAGGDGAPMHVTGGGVGPSFDAREPGLHPRPVGAHLKRLGPDLAWWDGRRGPGLVEQRHEILGAGEHEHVGIDRVLIAR